MNTGPYRKRPGDLEIRVLRDGRLVLIGPDQALYDLAKAINDWAASQKGYDDDGQSGPAGNIQ